jgi:hypothetical protein
MGGILVNGVLQYQETFWRANAAAGPATNPQADPRNKHFACQKRGKYPVLPFFAEASQREKSAASQPSQAWQFLPPIDSEPQEP